MSPEPDIRPDLFSQEFEKVTTHVEVMLEAIELGELLYGGHVPPQAETNWLEIATRYPEVSDRIIKIYQNYEKGSNVLNGTNGVNGYSEIEIAAMMRRFRLLSDDPQLLKVMTYIVAGRVANGNNIEPKRFLEESGKMVETIESLKGSSIFTYNSLAKILLQGTI